MADESPVAPIVSFVAGFEGDWRIDGIFAHKGESLPPAAHLALVEGDGSAGAPGRWTLRGIVLPGDGAGARAPLGRAEARCGALIAIRKSPAWWAMSAEEQDAVSAGGPDQATIGLDSFPAIAGRLHQSHELSEPFDYLHWYEYAPTDQAMFDELVGGLRTTEEWSFVEREVDISVSR